VFLDSEDHKYLAPIARLRYDIIKKYSKILETCTEDKKRQELTRKIKLVESFRKNVFKHLGIKRSQQQSLENKDIYVARHHFPHSYMMEKSTKCNVSEPITKEKAQSLGIGTLPHDKANLATKGSEPPYIETYFLSPNVGKVTVEGVIKSIGGSSTCKRYNDRINRQLFQTPPTKKAISMSVTNGETLKEKETVEENEIHTYLYPVPVLMEKLQSIVEYEIKSSECRNKSSGAILTEPLNIALARNVHFKNISMLLSRIYKNRNGSKIPTNPELHLMFCNGSVDTSNTYCSNVIVSLNELQNPRCYECLRRGKNSKRRVVGRNANIHKGHVLLAIEINFQACGTWYSMQSTEVECSEIVAPSHASRHY